MSEGRLIELRRDFDEYIFERFVKVLANPSTSAAPFGLTRTPMVDILADQP
jgi:hypothetical protein